MLVNYGVFEVLLDLEPQEGILIRQRKYEVIFTREWLITGNLPHSKHSITVVLKYEMMTRYAKSHGQFCFVDCKVSSIITLKLHKMVIFAITLIYIVMVLKEYPASCRSEDYNEVPKKDDCES